MVASLIMLPTIRGHRARRLSRLVALLMHLMVAVLLAIGLTYATTGTALVALRREEAFLISILCLLVWQTMPWLVRSQRASEDR